MSSRRYLEEFKIESGFQRMTSGLGLDQGVLPQGLWNSVTTRQHSSQHPDAGFIYKKRWCQRHKA